MSFIYSYAKKLVLLIRSLKIQHLFKISRQWNEFYSLESVKTSTVSFQNFSKGKRGNFIASDMKQHIHIIAMFLLIVTVLQRPQSLPSRQRFWWEDFSCSVSNTRSFMILAEYSSCSFLDVVQWKLAKRLRSEEGS